MSHDITEGRVAVEAQKKYGVVVQHGTQRRSDAGIAALMSGLKAASYLGLKLLMVTAANHATVLDSRHPVIRHRILTGICGKARLSLINIMTTWFIITGTGSGEVATVT